MSDRLAWPAELVTPVAAEAKWCHAGSNLILDFHGDPVSANLVVFSDGNHHMALEQATQSFIASHPEVKDVLSCTGSRLRAGKLHNGFVFQVKYLAWQRCPQVNSDLFMHSAVKIAR